MDKSLINIMADLSTNPSPDRLRFMRSLLGYQFDSAVTMLNQAPFGARVLLTLAVQSMLQYRAWELCRCWPDDDEILAVLEQLDPLAYGLAQRFYSETDETVCAQLADEIAAHTIGARAETPVDAFAS